MRYYFEIKAIKILFRYPINIHLFITYLNKYFSFTGNHTGRLHIFHWLSIWAPVYRTQQGLSGSRGGLGCTRLHSSSILLLYGLAQGMCTRIYCKIMFTMICYNIVGNGVMTMEFLYPPFVNVIQASAKSLDIIIMSRPNIQYVTCFLTALSFIYFWKGSYTFGQFGSQFNELFIPLLVWIGYSCSSLLYK